MCAGRTRVEERAIPPVGRSEQTGTCSLQCTGRCTWLSAGAVGAVALRSACSVRGAETGEYLVVVAHRPRRVKVLGRPGLDIAALLCRCGFPELGRRKSSGRAGVQTLFCPGLGRTIWCLRGWCRYHRW
ncbi:hypothetical protein NDU88_006854 [Pleurodeles waltl]|uniref:Uncharacterized protein n=1 Tax=Pleurodeles waltl TaxID=8319 RepID=A0AAV7LQD2_PLEWA|nr:hypothetical protein NDU88_006854 [Pleurodeles waltl]